MLVKSVCKTCIYDYLLKYHLQLVRGGHKSWIKAHAKYFDGWFEDNYGRNTKLPCPMQAEWLTEQAYLKADFKSYKAILTVKYKPFNHGWCFVYMTKPPENCEYILEHLVSRGV